MKGFKFDKPYQKSTVNAGSNGQIYYFKIPKDHIAFIDRIASNFYANTYFIFEIDGEKVEKENNITRQLGEIQNPSIINPPLIAKYEIKVTAYNNTSENLDFEVLIDGTIYENRG